MMATSAISDMDDAVEMEAEVFEMLTKLDTESL